MNIPPVAVIHALGTVVIAIPLLLALIVYRIIWLPVFLLSLPFRPLRSER